MTANVVPAGDFQYIKAQLEDTQESLAAAFARIEVFRLREKLLVAEIAKLRIGDQQQADEDATAAAALNAALGGTAAAGAAAAKQQPAGASRSSQPGTPGSQQQQQQQQEQQDNQSNWPLPCYVTEVEDHLPVMLFSSGGRKTPGSIVITEDYVDFVEVRARVKRHEFVGFTSAPCYAPGAARMAQTSSSFTATWKQFLPSCLSPDPGSPTAAAHRSSRVAASSDGGFGGPGPLAAADVGVGGSWAAADAGVGVPSTSSSTAVTGVTSGGTGVTGGPTRRHHSATSSPAWAHSPTAGSLSPRAPTLNHSSTWHHTSQSHLGPAGGTAGGTAGYTSSAGSGGVDGTTGVWQILWRSGGQQKHLAFEATQDTREVLHRHTAKWLNGGTHHSEDDDAHDVLAAVAAAGAAAPAAGAGGEGLLEMTVPRHLVPGRYTPRLSEPSSILSSPGSSSGLVDGLLHLAAALPARYRTRDWTLAYATARHGISLHTLYRRASSLSPTLLLVRDTGGYVFGAFCAEPWKVAPRFFGTGETFVFQLEPHKVMFPWKVKSQMKNDFFMYAQQEALAVGGLGAFAIWLDAELLQGSSGSCGTFGSPCLASREEFKVAALELWALQ